MESLERIRSVVRFQQTDRPPVIPEMIAVTATIAGVSPKEYAKSGDMVAECQLSAQERIGHDAVFAMADLCVEAEALGCKLEFPEDNYPYVKETILSDLEGLKGLAIPDPAKDGRMPEMLKAVRLMKAKVGGKVPVMAHTIGPLTLASRIMDIEKMLYMMVDHPDKFKAILEFCLNVSTEFASALVKEGADGIIVFDPTASPSVLPAKIFTQFELGMLQRMFSKVREINPEIITWYSVAGPLQTNLSILNAVAADISTFDYVVPVETALKYCGSTVLNGNIKPYLFLEGTPDAIRKESSSLLKATRMMERFILGSGCEIPLYSKIENITAMVDAVKEESERVEAVNAEMDGLQEVRIFPHRKKIYVKKGSSLLETIHNSDIGITSYCDKSGSCGKCVVTLKNGEVKPPGKIEKLQLTAQKSGDEERLACCIGVQSPMEIYIPYKTRIFRGYSNVPIEMYKSSIKQELEKQKFKPNISIFTISLGTDGKKGMSLEKILKDEFPGFSICEQARKKFPLFERNGHKEASLVIDNQGKLVMDVTNNKRIYGLAIDIGTTTISAYLHNLNDGKLECVGFTANGQNQWGADIITRAARIAEEPELLEKMQERLVEEINTLISGFHRDYSISNDCIYEIVAVANPVIAHLFLGIDPKQLTESPFISCLSGWTSVSIDYKPAFTHLSVNQCCRINVMPEIGGFVGGDAVAGVMAAGMHEKEELSILIDVGTNGEVVIGNSKRLVSTSLAAGSAFEGAHLSHGRACQNGTIHKINFDDDGNIFCNTLGGAVPFGLCGSSVIDAIAGFLKKGIIDKRGRFTTDGKWPQVKGDRFILVPKQKAATFSPIYISAKDIEEIQKAKSAIRTGIDLLMKNMGITPDMIKNVYISGSFGICIDEKNARTIGLIPHFPQAKFNSIKNSAGVGSRLALLSMNAREKAEKIASFAEHVNLANNPEFNNMFIDNMLFKEAN